MNKGKSFLSLLLLLCPFSQIKCLEGSSTCESEHVVENDEQKDHLLSYFIKSNLFSDFKEDELRSVYYSLSDDYIKRRIVSFLASSSKYNYDEANSLFDKILHEDITSLKDMAIRPIVLTPKMIELKKSILSTSYGMFQNWQTSGYCDPTTPNKNFNYLTETNPSFASAFARISCYLYLFRMSNQPTYLFAKALSIAKGDLLNTLTDEEKDQCRKILSLIYHVFFCIN